jgi:hypothetical protein
LLLAAPAAAEELGDQITIHPTRGAATGASDWLLLTTSNFRFRYRSGDAELASQAATEAESARKRILREWFAEDLPATWRVKCDVSIHPSLVSYTAATNRRAQTAGYSSVTLRHGRVVSRRIDLLANGSNLLHAVLPHEISHVVFASQFADRPPPLWVDEGMAMMSEQASTKCRYKRKLDQSFERGTWFSAEQLMSMKEYPSEELREVFYAQSMSLVEFFMSQRSAIHLVEFVRSLELNGYAVALRRVYGVSSLDQLDELWRKHLIDLAASRQERAEPADSGEPGAGSIDASSAAAVPQMIASEMREN